MDDRENERGEYIIPDRCEKCGSQDILAVAIFDTKIVRYRCLDCNYSRSLPKQENMSKRTPTRHNKWATEVKIRDKRCQICESGYNLEAHHIIPVAHSVELMYEPKNGITLCRDCHQLVHHKPNKEKEI